jgi:hypothetical protein
MHKLVAGAPYRDDDVGSTRGDELMDWHVPDGLLSVVVVVVAQIVRRLGSRAGRRAYEARSEQRGELADLIAVLPAGTRLMQRRPDGTVVRISLPGPPTTVPQR